MSQDDYVNFMEYYGSDGIYPTEALFDLEYEEFAKAWKQFKHAQPNLATEFDSVAREIMRDRLLFLRTGDYVGGICNPDVKGTFE